MSSRLSLFKNIDFSYVPLFEGEEKIDLNTLKIKIKIWLQSRNKVLEINSLHHLHIIYSFRDIVPRMRGLFQKY